MDKDIDTPLLIQYVNLLHKYKNPYAKEVTLFLKEHNDDTVFVERAKVLNKVFMFSVMGKLRSEKL